MWPLRTLADGSFETPENLMIGAAYRLAVREPGKEPINSDWIAIERKSQTIPAMVMSGLHTIRGRVVDRQGNPVGGAQVFQTGDGPKRTASETDSDGRFALDGFRPGPVFLFARRDGFRFHGQLIRPGEALVSVQLTRSSERPDREMKMLGDPIPLA